MTMRWPVLLTIVSLFGSGVALAQDPPVTKKAPSTKKARPARRAPARKAPAKWQKAARKKAAPQKAASAAAQPGDVQVDAARTMAKIANAESKCLRTASQKVQQAAFRLSGARSPESIEKRRGKLAFAVGVMDECRNIARDRAEKIAVPTAVPAKPKAELIRTERVITVPADMPLDQITGDMVTADMAKAVKNVQGSFGFGNILVKEGALHPGDFVSSLRRSRPSFERCYQRALVRSPDLSGTVQLNMRFVDRKHAARPQTVAIPSSSLGDKETHRCLANALMNTKFPHSAAGSEVSVKMAFAPKK
jgi:hypothetical protein